MNSGGNRWTFIVKCMQTAKMKLLTMHCLYDFVSFEI